VGMLLGEKESDTDAENVLLVVAENIFDSVETPESVIETELIGVTECENESKGETEEETEFDDEKLEVIVGPSESDEEDDLVANTERDTEAEEVVDLVLEVDRVARTEAEPLLVGVLRADGDLKEEALAKEREAFPEELTDGVLVKVGLSVNTKEVVKESVRVKDDRDDVERETNEEAVIELVTRAVWLTLPIEDREKIMEGDFDEDEHAVEEKNNEGVSLGEVVGESEASWEALSEKEETMEDDGDFVESNDREDAVLGV